MKEKDEVQAIIDSRFHFIGERFRDGDIDKDELHLYLMGDVLVEVANSERLAEREQPLGKALRALYDMAMSIDRRLNKNSESAELHDKYVRFLEARIERLEELVRQPLTTLIDIHKAVGFEGEEGSFPKYIFERIDEIDNRFPEMMELRERGKEILDRKKED